MWIKIDSHMHRLGMFLLSLRVWTFAILMLAAAGGVNAQIIPSGIFLGILE
jgi:hypothetical protein